MSTPVSPAEQRILLKNVSRDTYENLLKDLPDCSSPRLTYDHGVLEIMSPSPEHEERNRTLNLMVEVLAEEKGVHLRNLGSTTYKRHEFMRGFGPDSSFYIQSAELIRGKIQIDLLLDPPPDLVIEIDISRDHIDKLAIYEQFRVQELWVYRTGRVLILVLEGSEYQESLESLSFPGLTSMAISRFLEDSMAADRPDWLRKLRGWIRKQAWVKKRRIR